MEWSCFVCFDFCFANAYLFINSILFLGISYSERTLDSYLEGILGITDLILYVISLPYQSLDEPFLTELVSAVKGIVFYRSRRPKDSWQAINVGLQQKQPRLCPQET